ncbi:hypothetical protein [Streptomyces sp. NPDC001194]|uniref:hypothetical protein n=1 Tax=Streptomyces sp. NPDC001194 TaxID=3364547 RepID=UPI0036AEBE31
MGIKSRLRDAAWAAVNTSDGTPAGARRATMGASQIAEALSNAGHTKAAIAASAAGAAAVAAEGALTNLIYPPGDYAEFHNGPVKGR